jgi:hypothetical protein
MANDKEKTNCTPSHPMGLSFRPLGKKKQKTKQ